MPYALRGPLAGPGRWASEGGHGAAARPPRRPGCTPCCPWWGATHTIASQCGWRSVLCGLRGRPMPAMNAQFGRSVAVVVGIDAYCAGLPRLTSAVNDARRLAEILRTHHGYDVRSLLDGEA